MKTGKRWALAVGLAAVVAAGSFVAACRAPARAEDRKAEKQEPPAKGEERKAEKNEPPASGRRAAFIAAYNKGDARAVASFWTPNATFVDATGREYKGREAIEKLYAKQFAAKKGAKLVIHVTSTSSLTPEVVIEDGITEVTPANGGFPAATRFTAVLVKKDGEWFLQCVRDAVPHPPSNAEHLEDLEWLIGEWAGETDKGESGNATYDWAENQNFIVSRFATTLEGVPVTGGSQWIGWDPVDRQIRSWSFYSSGGFGEAVWTQDGNKWALKTTARTGAGKKMSATNIVTKTDNDHMTWQVTKLIVNGEPVPDLKPVKMKRVKPAQP
jgi:uncharacterized protein (TIGR02246 family)